MRRSRAKTRARAAKPARKDFLSRARRIESERKQVEAHVRRNPGVTTNEIRDAMGWGAQRTKDRLDALESARVLERDTTHGRFHHWFMRGAKPQDWLARHHLADPELLMLWETLKLHPCHEAGYYADVMDWNPRTAWHWLVEFSKVGLAVREDGKDGALVWLWKAGTPEGLDPGNRQNRSRSELSAGARKTAAT